MGRSNVRDRYPLRYTSREEARKQAKRRTLLSPSVDLFILDDTAATPERRWCLDTSPLPLGGQVLVETWRAGRCRRLHDGTG